jgi:hypothetical protein
MEWNQVPTHWQYVGAIAATVFPELSDEDLDNIAGNRTKWVDYLVRLYALERAEAERQLDEWMKQVPPPRLSLNARKIQEAHRRSVSRKPSIFRRLIERFN